MSGPGEGGGNHVNPCPWCGCGPVFECTTAHDAMCIVRCPHMEAEGWFPHMEARGATLGDALREWNRITAPLFFESYAVGLNESRRRRERARAEREAERRRLAAVKECEMLRQAVDYAWDGEDERPVMGWRCSMCAHVAYDGGERPERCPGCGREITAWEDD